MSCVKKQQASGRGRLGACLSMLLFLVLTLLPIQAVALEAVKISREDKALDLTKVVEIYASQGEAFQVSTAAGTDGIVRRIEVRASSDQRSTKLGSKSP